MRAAARLAGVRRAAADGRLARRARRTSTQDVAAADVLDQARVRRGARRRRAGRGLAARAARACGSAGCPGRAGRAGARDVGARRGRAARRRRRRERAELVLGGTWNACPLNIAVLSLPVFVAALWAMKGLAPTRPALAGAAAGLLAGAVGAVVYTLHCPELAAPFLGTWYVARHADPDRARRVHRTAACCAGDFLAPVAPGRRPARGQRNSSRIGA